MIQGLVKIGEMIQQVFVSMANVHIPLGNGYSVSIYTIAITVILFNLFVFVIGRVAAGTASSIRNDARTLENRRLSNKMKAKKETSKKGG